MTADITEVVQTSKKPLRVSQVGPSPPPALVLFGWRYIYITYTYTYICICGGGRASEREHTRERTCLFKPPFIFSSP